MDSVVRMMFGNRMLILLVFAGLTVFMVIMRSN